VGRLIYLGLTSLDGYIADEHGNFDWAAPDEEVHTFVNDLMRPVGTHLYGRRMYEVMVAWETMSLAGEPPVVWDFAELWHAAEKVVYSTTLQAVSSARTRIEREVDPAAIRQLKTDTDHDLAIGGPTVAAAAIRHGLVDDWHLFLTPIVVGGGTPFFPGNARVALDLVDQRRFRSGVVYLRYRTRA
jgi:dihydrofolate reductase